MPVVMLNGVKHLVLAISAFMKAAHQQVCANYQMLR
jgi:hypothetical protein